MKRYAIEVCNKANQHIKVTFSLETLKSVHPNLHCRTAFEFSFAWKCIRQRRTSDDIQCQQCLLNLVGNSRHFFLQKRFCKHRIKNHSVFFVQSRGVRESMIVCWAGNEQAGGYGVNFDVFSKEIPIPMLLRKLKGTFEQQISFFFFCLLMPDCVI